MKQQVVPRSGSSMTSPATNAKPGTQRQEQVPGPAQRAELLLAGEQVGAPQQHRRPWRAPTAAAAAGRGRSSGGAP